MNIDNIEEATIKKKEIDKIDLLLSKIYNNTLDIGYVKSKHGVPDSNFISILVIGGSESKLSKIIGEYISKGLLNYKQELVEQIKQL